MLGTTAPGNFQRAKEDITQFSATKFYDQLNKIGTKKATIQFITRKFDALFKELKNNPSIDRFKKEYQGLLQTVQYSFETEQKLIVKCRELTDVILINAARVKSVLESSQKDASTIAALKKMVDSAKSRQDSLSKANNGLKLQVQQQKSASMVSSSKSMVSNRRQEKTLVEDSKQQDIDKFREEIQNLKRALKRSEQQKIREECKCKELQHKLLSSPSINLRKQPHRSSSTTHMQHKTNDVAPKSSQISELRAEVKQLNLKVKQQQNLYEAVRSDRNLYSKNLIEAQGEVAELKKQLKETKGQIATQKLEKAEILGKLKQQQNLYEAVRTDRNLYSKNLIEAQNELQHFKAHSKKASHQISILKDEIKNKDGALTSKQIQNQKFQKIVEKTRSSYDQLKRQSDKQKDELNTSKRDISKLNNFIESAQRELKKQKKTYEGVINKMWA